MKGFDNIAWCYDALATLVFGDRLNKVQSAFLHQVRSGSNVLILGGGTGRIAEELLQHQPTCTITFIDASGSMVDRARRRLGNRANLTILQGTEASIPVGETYDVVITPFFLDMFPKDRLQQIIAGISAHLKDSALWLVADFINSPAAWHRFQLAVMYFFFRIVTGIEASSLPDWDGALKDAGWKKSKSMIIQGFIEGAVYERTGLLQPE